MRKHPDTSEKTMLALELLRRIPRVGLVTTAQLQEQLANIGLQRDLRTIQRHLKTLSEQFDVERDECSKPYGYRWKQCARGLAMPMLSEQDSLLLTLAQQHLRNLLPAKLMNSMQGFFHQARTNLGPHLDDAQHSREWLSKVRVVSETQPLLAPAIKDGVFEAVSNALYANLWLELDYKNGAGKRAKVDVMPLGLAQQGPCLYLVCRYRGYDNERSLALHRIISATASTLTFERPKEFNLEQYDNDGRFGFGKGERIKLTFRIKKSSGRHLLESRLSTDQVVTEFDDEYEITATVVDTARLDWWLRGFGERVSEIRKKREIV
jgi:predicted DNA-binding transcriptional regulator YafY